MLGTVVIIVVAVIVGVAGAPAIFCWLRRKRREKLKRAITIVPEDSFSACSSNHEDLTNENSTEMVSRTEGGGRTVTPGRGTSLDVYRSTLPLAISLSATSAMPTDVSSSSSVLPSLPQADAVLVSNDHVPRAQVIFSSGVTTLGGAVGTEEVEDWQFRRKPQRRRSSEGGGGRSGNSPTRPDRRERRYLEWDEEEEVAERKYNDESV